ncbi:MAG: hypothetical protein Q4Q23_07755, partial [Methanobacteriaceae archaeon]|nr:hypothetical protein [Methanobacteriaceae archaeon]
NSLLCINSKTIENMFADLIVVTEETEYYPKILQEIERICKIDPENIELLDFKLLLLIMNQDPNIIEEIDKAIEIYPDPEFYIYKSKELYKQGNEIESYNCIDKALQLDDEYYEAVKLKGFALFMKEDYHEAIKYFEKALTLIDDSYEELEIMGTFVDCVLTIRLENNEDPILEKYETILELDDAYEKAKKYVQEKPTNYVEKAIEELEKVIEIHPRYKNTAEIYLNLVYLNNEMEKAEEVIHDIKETFSEDVEFLKEIMELFNNQGNYEYSLRLALSIPNEVMDLELIILYLDALKYMGEYEVALELIEELNLKAQLEFELLDLKAELYLKEGKVRQAKEIIELNMKLSDKQEEKEYLNDILEEISYT